ncbi:fungal-specific transcription factor domain-containing protein [Ganoderma leucocontextum]|nr:fungal-specific transcription factor domain-containing protein [Ganoderma leucocontextum]
MASFQELAHNPPFNLSDEDNLNEPGSSNQPAVRRGTRACDRCRKIKSKCEVGSEDKCKNCGIANTRPSFKRGPPKGYIHSIEQRWNQVECILATIMESPRAQDIITDLRHDAFANAILDRVQAGPYGAASPIQQQDPTSDSFYASLVEVPEYTPLRDDRRSRRQSRVSREIVSQDPTASATPTREWQDQLSRRLAHNSQWPSLSSPVSATSRSSSRADGGGTDQSRTRRRLSYGGSAQQQRWDDLYTLPDANQPTCGPGNVPVEDTAEAFGQLSVDQNKELRYHGPASGLPLLAQSHRKSASDKEVNRIWRFSQNGDSEQPSYDAMREEEEIDVELPPPDVQSFLLQLYFAYVHPFFPIIHKQDFLHNYRATDHNVPPSHQTQTFTNPHLMQRRCKMLLLSMFAIAARYSNRPEDHQAPDGRFVTAGQQYAQDAHRLLDKKYQSSQPSTCQALLLLAIRAFGMGAMDKGWLYSGTALRMAVDLGMNRNADNWTIDGKQPLFTEVEKQIRKHIWWSCCISDKLSAVWLGRPITFRANDYSTPLPDINEVDETEVWQPYPPGVLGNFAPQTAKLMSCFREACNLSVIITDIMDKIYPVQVSTSTSRRVLLEELESRLNKWLNELPRDLRYSPNDKHTTVLPHILVLHIEYNAAVLLLHRAFLPAYDETVSHPTVLQSDPIALKAFDVCTGAAAQISAMAESYSDMFGLESAPPFMCIYLQSAGIMHVVALARQPSDPQASLGLTRCIEACKQIERLWPFTTRLRMLLEGERAHLDEYKYRPQTGSGRKRNAEDALGSHKNPDVSVRDLYAVPPVDSYSSTSSSNNSSWDSAPHARMVAHSLGMHAPHAEASTSFHPGYQWWPIQLINTEGLPQMPPTASTDVSAPISYSALPGYSQRQPHVPHPPPLHTPQTSTGMQEPFTFGQGHLSQDFVHDVNYPSFPLDRHYASHPSRSRHDSTPRQ